MPRVSICIPSYKPKHFEICLASAVAQTFTDTEIIVSDDCPTDDIRQICDKFPGRVKYSRNPNPGGRSNFIRVLSLAEGEYIKFLFDDDILHPFCVQYLWQTLESTRGRNTRLAFSPRDTIDADNNTTGTINMLNVSGSEIRLLKGSECISLIASNCTNFIGEFSTVMFRREDSIDASGRTLIDLPEMQSRALADVMAWMNLAKKGDIAIYPSTLSYFRQHKGSNSDPDANPDFIHAVGEWEDVVNHALAGGYLPRERQSKAYENLLRLLRRWVPLFPALTEGVQRVERQLAVISASA